VVVNMAIKIGLQMYSVREYMRFDPLGSLKKTAEAGYKYVELPIHYADESTSDFYEKNAVEWKAAAAECGIHITGAYVKNLSLNNIDDICSFYQALGCDHITIPIDYFPTRETLDEKCRLYNEMGKICKRYGMNLIYENHYHEFQKYNDRFIMDIIMDNTDPELFKLSLNTYWLMRGLIEPLDTFYKYQSRIYSVVQQDYPLDQIDKFNMWNFKNHHPIAQNIQYDNILQGGEIENIHPVQCELFTEIGNGIIKLQPVINAANEAGNVKYVFLKQDFTRKPSEFDSIKISLDNYKQLSGVEL
jgi:sugar phosphate isomerase/epimerase